VEKPPRPQAQGWDLVKTEAEENLTWLQIKSGPNTMDKDQIEFWLQKIQEKIQEGDRAFLGFTYGKRTNNTVTLALLQ